MLIGRITRDPESHVFPNGGKSVKFGFAVNNRKKDQSGQYVDDPVFIDCEAYDRGDYGKTASMIEQYLRKGSQAYLEGHLKLDQWTGQDGSKRSKLKLVIDACQFLDRRQDREESPVPQAEMVGPPPEKPATSLFENEKEEQIPF